MILTKGIKMNKGLFSEDTKMADVVLTNARLLYVLPYFDIALGFGEKTVRQVCADKNISVPLLLLVCNIFTFEDYTPGNAELRQIPIEGIIRYLQASHKDYLERRVPHLIDAVLGLSLEGDDAMLASFCEKYQQEVIAHLNYEEEIVFPYIHQLLNGEKPHYKISEYESNHSDIDAALKDLENLIVKFLSKNYSFESCRPVLLELFMFEHDLRKHALLEDTILIPMVERLDTGASHSDMDSVKLSERERETLALLARGLSNKEIADKLHISTHTVISHRKNIVKKTGIRTPQGLALYAHANNLIVQE